MNEKRIAFDDALVELQVATRELRELVSKGKIPAEGQGRQMTFRLAQVLDLKENLRDLRRAAPPVAQPKLAKGWKQSGGMVVWEGSVPEPGRVMLKTADHNWAQMHFRVFFDACGTLQKIGLAAGERAFVAETHGDATKWHSCFMEMHTGAGEVIIDDRDIFSGELEIPFLALCGEGPSELSKTGQDRLMFRGLKLQPLNV